MHPAVLHPLIGRGPPPFGRRGRYDERSHSYYDVRNQVPNNDVSETDHFLVHCHDADPTDTTDRCADPHGWSEVRITEEPFDLLEAPDAGRLFLGDYVGLSDTGDAFAPVSTRSNNETDPATGYYSIVEP